MKTIFKKGDTVIVPDPDDTDIHNHSFEGTVVGFRNSYVVVGDSEQNGFEIEPERLKLAESHSHPTIHVAIISHDHGENTYFAKSESGLMDQIYEYVKDNWDDEMDEVIPEDKQEAIDLYFETMGEIFGGAEYLEILDPVLLSEIPD